MNKMMKMGIALLFSVFAVSSASARSVYAYGDPGVRTAYEAHLGAAYAPDYLKEHGKLDLGKWYTDWATCKQYAEENGIPVVFIWSNKDCIHCWYSNLAFLEPSFTEWAATHDAGRVIYCFMSNGEKDEDGNTLPDQEDSTAYNWMWKQSNELSMYPFVTLYWNGNILLHMSGDDFCSGNATGTKFNAKTHLNIESMPDRVPNVIEKMEDAFKDWHLADDKENPFVLPVSRDGYGKGSLYLMSGPNWIKIETTENTKYAVRVLMDGSHDLSSPFAATSDDVTISEIDEKFGMGFQFVANEKSETLICLTAQSNIPVQLQYASMDVDVTVAFPCAEPIITHDAVSGGYGPERVTLSATAADAQIRYTLDGGAVSESSTLYEGPFVIEETTTVKAKAFRTGWAESEEVSAVIELKTHCDDGGPYTETVDGVEWTFFVQGGKATVAGDGWWVPAVPRETVGTIEIPSTLGQCPVTSIKDSAFESCSGLTSVTIPSSVMSIGEGAFVECSGLTSVVIPEGVTEIQCNTFYGCSGLTSVTIPSSVTSIGDYAFSGCTGLTSVTIPSSVTEIRYYAFSGCTGLTSVTMPEGVTSIWYGAFWGCSGLTSVTIPSSVTSIGMYVFYGCGSLLRVYFRGNAPETAELYDGSPEEFYSEVEDMTPITLVSYVREGSTGWSSCASADLPDSWQERPIAHGEVPVVVDGVEWNFTTKNGKVSLGSGLMAAVGGSVSGSVTIPAEINGMKVVEINDSAFAGLDGITSVVIPASVRTVGSKAFYGCDGLETVTFLGDAPYVYDDAFSGTKSTLAFSVPQGSIGWSDTSLTGLPGAWKGHAIQYAGGGQDVGGSAASLGTVTVSNIVVHYILNSVQPQFAISPSQDVGFVNIITEVKSTGVAAIPMSWASEYPNFVSKFGSDFTVALGKPTGKIGTGGTPMLVWQDYVAGTDPTDEKDVFTASITIVDGKVTISYSPELDDDRKAMRKYTTWGKASLMDANWTEVQEGHEAEYNFFKVSVEMR